MWMSSVFTPEVFGVFRTVNQTLAGMSKRPEEARGSGAELPPPPQWWPSPLPALFSYPRARNFTSNSTQVGEHKHQYKDTT